MQFIDKNSKLFKSHVQIYIITQLLAIFKKKGKKRSETSYFYKLLIFHPRHKKEGLRIVALYCTLHSREVWSRPFFAALIGIRSERERERERGESVSQYVYQKREIDNDRERVLYRVYSVYSICIWLYMQPPGVAVRGLLAGGFRTTDRFALPDKHSRRRYTRARVG